MSRYNEGTERKQRKRPRIESGLGNDTRVATVATELTVAATADAHTAIGNQEHASITLGTFIDELKSYPGTNPGPLTDVLVPQSNELYEMRKRFQLLLQSERIKYQCPDYAQDCVACSSSDEPDDQVALDLRLNRVLAVREKILCLLYDMADRHRIDTGAVSAAAFIFDQYLSRFVPNYVKGSVDMPHLFSIIGVACLFIAAKSQLARRDLSFIGKLLHQNPYSKQILNVELKILVDLRWNIVYPSPISIVRDLIIVLPRPRGDQRFDETLEIFKDSILQEASRLTKLAAVTYGFVNKFPPSTIALAALRISLENQCSSKNVAIFDLTRPIVHFASMLEKHELGLSYGDEDVKQCHLQMVRGTNNQTYSGKPINGR